MNYLKKMLLINKLSLSFKNQKVQKVLFLLWKQLIYPIISQAILTNIERVY